MKIAITTLQDHPLIGMISTLFAFVSSFIADSTPVIQWLSMLVFLSIGVVTLILKFKQLFKK
jgi:hypothetical protein